MRECSPVDESIGRTPRWTDCRGCPAPACCRPGSPVRRGHRPDRGGRPGARDGGDLRPRQAHPVGRLRSIRIHHRPLPGSGQRSAAPAGRRRWQRPSERWRTRRARGRRRCVEPGRPPMPGPCRRTARSQSVGERQPAVAQPCGEQLGQEGRRHQRPEGEADQRVAEQKASGPPSRSSGAYSTTNAADPPYSPPTAMPCPEAAPAGQGRATRSSDTWGAGRWRRSPLP
jgi:hypothetical protein